MLNLNLAQQKLIEYYGKNVRESVIFMNQKQVQMLVETDKSYEGYRQENADLQR